MKWEKMKYIFLAVLPLFIWNCKEQKPVQQSAKTVEAVVKPVPKIIKDMALFADVNLTGATEIADVMVFKTIDKEGIVHDISMEEASKLCKQAMTRKQVTSHPIIECIQNSKSILIVQAKGYGGPIWGKLLVNSEDMVLEKVGFDHSSESEGYGAGITLSSFENQFTAVDISQPSFGYGLRQNNKTIIDGSHMVDGISGATQTSASTVEMMNEGLMPYQNYIKNKKKVVQ